MILKPGCEEEYAKRHAAIWPELKQMIKDQGVGNYSIFWDKETNLLFAYQECEGEGNSQDTRQFARHHSAEGTFPHGLRFNGECRMENGKL